ncbi:hypothetical protein P7C73_g1833, partial [Tremellales sp. Uapishka_1]
MASALPSARDSLQPLPFHLDLTCPITLPCRSTPSSDWPFALAQVGPLVSLALLISMHRGPSHAPQEPLQAFVKRRYLETLFLSDLLFPLPTFVADLGRIPFTTLSHLIAPLLLSLSQIEYRHRKVLTPVISAILSAETAKTSTHNELLDQAVASSGLHRDEARVIKMATSLRVHCRAAEEGSVPLRKLSEEFERREVLVQIVLLLLYMTHLPPTETNETPSDKPKKRKRDRRQSPLQTPIEEPKGSLELLADRLSVWLAVSDLGIHDDDPKGKAKEKEGVQPMLKRFWEEVVVVFFLKPQPDFCASLHLKLFNAAIDPALLPKPTKKPRKPTITHPRPSTDGPPHLLSVPRRPSSVASNSTRQRASSVISEHKAQRPEEPQIQRSISRGSDSRRSRSRSIDPVPKKPFARAPSGKELFGKREVGLMRRSASTVVRKDSNESQGGGLLGRKTSDPRKIKMRKPSFGESQSLQRSQSQSDTIIFATPSKPRQSIFGAKLAHHPTPIQEEPPSAPRPSWIAETPVVANRIVDRAPLADEDDDTLADLMVMTDEEDEPSNPREMVPETPIK